MSKLPVIAAATLSAALWAIAGVASTGALPDGVTDVACAGGVMTGTGAMVLWKARADARRSASVSLLVRTIASVTRPDGARAGLQLVREAGAEAPPEAPVQLRR